VSTVVYYMICTAVFIALMDADRISESLLTCTASMHKC